MMPITCDLRLYSCLGASFLDLESLVETLTGGRIHFVWILFGLMAQLLIVGCLLAQRRASRQEGRSIITPPVIYVGLVATVMLLVYASLRHDIVFAIGQVLNVIVGMRILEMLRRPEVKKKRPEKTSFPDVKPHSAERKTPSKFS